MAINCYACGEHLADSRIEYYISEEDGGRQYHPKCFSRLVCMALSMENSDTPLSLALIQVAGRITFYSEDGDDTQ